MYVMMTKAFMSVLAWICNSGHLNNLQHEQYAIEDNDVRNVNTVCTVR